MRGGSTRGSVAGGNTVTGDFWPWRGAPGTEREQFSAEEREGIGGGAAQEGTAGKDSVGEIDMTPVFGRALRHVHGPGGGLGEIKDEEDGENLLEDEVGLFRVKMDETHGIF